MIGAISGRETRYLGVLLALLAWGMAAAAAYTAVRWWLMGRWPTASCVVAASAVEVSEGYRPYRFRVEYAYPWLGREYTGAVYREDFRGTFDIAEADRLARAYPVGGIRRCHVNPARPDESVLEPDDPRLPLAIVAVMVPAGLYLLLAFTRGERAVAGITGPFLMAMGLGGFGALFAPSLAAGWAARAYVPTPCTVADARVRSETHHGLLTITAWWPDVVYSYRVGGATYRANTVNASSVGSPWYYGARRTADDYPAGAAATCYVDPADPARAVLDRSFSDTQLFGVWPLVIAALGAYTLACKVAGRELPVGSPRLWGTLALGSATVVALHIALIANADLGHDWRRGRAELLEAAPALAAAVIALGLLLAWIRLAIRPDPGRVPFDPEDEDENEHHDPDQDPPEIPKDRPADDL